MIKRLVERVKDEPVLLLTAVLAVASQWLSPDEVSILRQVLELALYLGLGVAVRQRTTPQRKAKAREQEAFYRGQMIGPPDES